MQQQQPKEPKKEQPKPQTRKQREDEHFFLTKHTHPPTWTTFKTTSGRIVRF